MALSKQLGISIEEAEALVDDYFETFPQLHDFIESSKQVALKQGYVVFENKLQALFIQDKYHDLMEKSRIARSHFMKPEYYELNTKDREEFKKKLYIEKPYLKEWYTDIGIMKSRLGNRGCNLKIQGTSAKQSKYAQMKMRKHAIENPDLNWEICLLLHDEVVSETTKDNAEEVAKLQDEYMVEAANYFCPDVKFSTGGQIGSVWDH